MLDVQVGAMVEVTNEEARQLRQLGELMHRAALSQEKGWLGEYVRAHNSVGKIVRAMLDRAHAPRDPRQLELL